MLASAAPPGPSAATASASPPPPQRVGLVLVHGIGEQRRFQHLDSQLRDLLRALGKLGHHATVDINGSGSAAFHAEQDTWNAGPGASVVVSLRSRTPSDPVTHELHVHEVWWADINEPYSIAKQVRFWFWGLAVWAGLGKRGTSLAGANEVEPPMVGAGDRPWFLAWARFRLYLVGFIFALGGLSVGVATFLATRLFHWQPPALLKVVTNYVSGVKLYSEKYRHGPGLGVRASPQELLDNVDCPPRTSVRRRMMRTIADVACARTEPDPTTGRDERLYERWYVFAHSLGSIVAFNGLMETGYAWPGYLDRERWKRLVELGMVRHNAMPLADGKRTMPPRPAWALPGDSVKREAIFERFHGVLTYGSPLEKFATIWPARVPLSRKAAFQPCARWFNVFDPTDPVSGVLKSFSSPPNTVANSPLLCCPPVTNIGYRSYWVLLQSHLHYLTASKDDFGLATQAMRWVLENKPEHMTAAPASGQGVAPIPHSFQPGSAPFYRRHAGAWLWWLAAAYGLAGLAGATLPGAAYAVLSQARSVWPALRSFPLLRHLLHWDRRDLVREAFVALREFLAGSWLGMAVHTVDGAFCRAGTWALLPARSGSFVLASLVVPLVLGGLFALLSKRDDDDADLHK